MPFGFMQSLVEVASIVFVQERNESTVKHFVLASEPDAW